jgi:hypothetical protein
MVINHLNKCLIPREKGSMKLRKSLIRKGTDQVTRVGIYIKGTRYLIHWKGYKESERTWEPC